MVTRELADEWVPGVPGFGDAVDEHDRGSVTVASYAMRAPSGVVTVVTARNVTRGYSGASGAVPFGV
jgi:hypothetical protein